MAQPVLLPAAFDGMVQDFPRNNLPRGRCWNFVDFIPQSLGAPATERGGWAYASLSLTGVDASAAYVKAGVYASFTTGYENLAIDDLGKLIKVVSSASSVSIGTVNTPLQNPVQHQQVVIIPNNDGSTQMFKYTGGTSTGMGTSVVPTARYAAVFVNRTVVASTTAQPQRVYFSSAGDGTAYSMTGTSASYLDVGFAVKGLAALPNVLLVFGDTRTARIRGTTPPPGTDMQVDDPIFNYGTSDARSIAVNGSQACFANDIGVFITNGTAFPEDLTKSCGISKYWRDLNTGRTSSWTLAGGWFGNVYLITIMNGSTLIDTIAFDTQKRAAYRFSNLKALAYWAAGAAGQELYAGSRVAPRVLQLSTMWTPSATYKNDGDGTAVTGTYETPFYDTPKIGGQRWIDLFFEHDLRDAASDDPTWALSYCKSPEAGAAYTAMSPTVSETTGRTIVEVPIHDKSIGMGFKITRTNAASYARIYSLGSTAYQREGSRRDYS